MNRGAPNDLDAKFEGQCEGFARVGGAFTLGPVYWTRCQNKGAVDLTTEQDGETSTRPACLECWREAKGAGVKIIEAKPRPDAEGDADDS